MRRARSGARPETPEDLGRQRDSQHLSRRTEIKICSLSEMKQSAPLARGGVDPWAVLAVRGCRCREATCRTSGSSTRWCLPHRGRDRRATGLVGRWLRVSGPNTERSTDVAPFRETTVRTRERLRLAVGADRLGGRFKLDRDRSFALRAVSEPHNSVGHGLQP